MFRLYFINFDYYSSEEFYTLDAAIAYGKSKGFEFRVSRQCQILYVWSPISGGREL